LFASQIKFCKAKQKKQGVLPRLAEAHAQAGEFCAAHQKSVAEHAMVFKTSP
jgi:hypothetical protein